MLFPKTGIGLGSFPKRKSNLKWAEVKCEMGSDQAK